MYSLTIFKSVYDNKTNKRIDLDTWDQFEALLYKLSKRKLKDKKEAELISPATYQPDTTRKNATVVEWARWAAVDVDDHIFEGDLESELRSKFGDYQFVCYSTASSTDLHPKFRLVFPLKTPVHQEKIKPFWFALQSELGDIGDRQTKDLSRMYYTPADYAGANNFIFTNTGVYIDPDAMIQKHPMEVKQTGKSFFERLPESMQRQIIQARKDAQETTNIRWSNYNDCPFVTRGQISAYQSISDSGWYHGMYKMMVSIAYKAVEAGYPITAHEIADLAREIDLANGNWYENRPLDIEADRAIEFVYKHQ